MSRRRASRSAGFLQKELARSRMTDTNPNPERPPNDLPPTADFATAGDASDKLSGISREGSGAARAAESGPRSGARIGPYQLRELLGEGGMGSVWMAEQVEPVRREVALKVIKPGLGSDHFLSRFEAERQTLALMDHPNIAKVLDAGTTDQGWPYFVMELVRGVPITRYCDEHRLTPRERLELFVPVCQALQHAHQKGIIHRDIKPSNVLVATYDGQPVPKVIDFGVAKAIGQPLTERSVFTGIGMIVGTLEYMSPEQAEFHALDIDTRSDVFSLGVLLYELLTGTTPLQRMRVAEIALTEILRLIREEEPPKPSTRLSQSGDSLTTISSQRRIEPGRLTNQVRGELDWIVMKALEKDRQRRYPSALDFAQDIQRYLADEPVQASPPSATYRLKKFARKHRWALATATAFLSLLVLATAVSFGLMLRATQAERDAVAAAHSEIQQRKRAEDAELRARSDRDAAVAARTAAEQQAAFLKETNDFLARDLLGQGDLANTAGGLQGTDPNVTVRTLLERASTNIEGKFANQPEVEARIRRTIGSAFRAVGDSVDAMRHLERARELAEKHFGASDTFHLDCLGELAMLHNDLQQYADALRIQEPLVQTTEQLFGSMHERTVAEKGNLALIYSYQGDYDKALPILKSVTATLALLPNQKEDLLVQQNNYAMTLIQLGRSQEAEPLLRQVLPETERSFGAKHLNTLRLKNNLAVALRDLKKFPEAEALFHEVAEVSQETGGLQNPLSLISQRQLALSHMAANQPAKAEPLFRAALAGYEQRPFDTERARQVRSELVGCLFQLKKLAEVEPLVKQAIEDAIAKWGQEHSETLRLKSDLAGLLRDTGQLVAAEKLFREVLEVRRRVLGSDHSYTAGNAQRLGVVLTKLDRDADAEPLLQEGYEHARAALGMKSALVQSYARELIGCYQRLQKASLADPICRELVEQTRTQFGPDSTELAGALALLGANLLRLEQKPIESEPVLRECWKIRAAKQPGTWTTWNSASMLGEALLQQGLTLRATDPQAAEAKLTEAEKLLVDGFEGLKRFKDQIPLTAKPRFVEAAQSLAKLYEATNRPEKAQPLRDLRL